MSLETVALSSVLATMSLVTVALSSVPHPGTLGIAALSSVPQSGTLGIAALSTVSVPTTDVQLGGAESINDQGRTINLSTLLRRSTMDLKAVSGDRMSCFPGSRIGI
jgi:hypothetical protein